MIKRVWKRLFGGERVEQPPGRVQRLLMWRYGVDTIVAARLLWARKPGYFAGLPADHVRIFDPWKLIRSGPGIDSYAALDDQMKAVLFEGRWQQGRLNLVKDLRKPESEDGRRAEAAVVIEEREAALLGSAE